MKYSERPAGFDCIHNQAQNAARYSTGDELSADKGIVFTAGSSTLMLPFSLHYWRNSPSRLCWLPLLGPRLSFSLYLLTHSLSLSLVHPPSLLLLWLGPLSRHTPPPFLSVPPATSPHPLFSISVEFSMWAAIPHAVSPPSTTLCRQTGLAF